jgi:hypothetical protein
LYFTLLAGYIVVAAVGGDKMQAMIKWGLMLFAVLGGLTCVSSYQTEQLIRTEWILITMGERSKRKVCTIFFLPYYFHYCVIFYFDFLKVLFLFIFL